MSKWGRRAVVLAAMGILAAATAPATSALADPPGNNGTIKIDAQPFDSAPDNEPHTACRFQVDWYGFDEGALYSDVTFEVQPPTGSDFVLLTDHVFVGHDAAGGGTDLDASRTYNLVPTLRQNGFNPQPQQGYHVKLTVHTDGSQGADVKHKVFWVQPCTSSS